MSEDCKSKMPCGCDDHPLGTPPPCEIGTTVCPDPEPCSETFSDCCIIHDGDGIADLNIQTGDRFCDILQKISLAISASGSVVTIESFELVGNDLIITMTDGTIFSVTLPSSSAPSESWVALSTGDITFVSFNPGPGISLNGVSGDIVHTIRYNIISPNTVSIQTQYFIPIIVDTTNPNFTGKFIFTSRFPAIIGSLGGWFPSVPKTFASTGLHVPGVMHIDPFISGAPYNFGCLLTKFETFFGSNQIRILCNLKDTNWEDGNFTLSLYTNATIELQ